MPVPAHMVTKAWWRMQAGTAVVCALQAVAPGSSTGSSSQVSRLETEAHRFRALASVSRALAASASCPFSAATSFAASSRDCTSHEISVLGHLHRMLLTSHHLTHQGCV